MVWSGLVWSVVRSGQVFPASSCLVLPCLACISPSTVCKYFKYPHLSLANLEVIWQVMDKFINLRP